MGKIKKLCTSSLLESALVPYSQDRPGRGKKENLQWNETILFLKFKKKKNTRFDIISSVMYLKFFH